MSALNQAIASYYVAAAGGISSPLDITGCIAWWDFSDANTLYDATSGGSLVAADGTIARIEDKSASAKHLTHATAGSRPIRKTSIQNGKDVGRFDGTDDGLFNASYGVNSQHWFAVCKYTNATFSTSNVCVQTGGTTNGRILRGSGAASSSWDSSLGTRRKDGAVSNTGPMAAWATHSAEYATGWLNTAIGIGSAQTGAALFWLGDIGEVIGYSTALSAPDLAAVELFLKTKWATP